MLSRYLIDTWLPARTISTLVNVWETETPPNLNQHYLADSFVICYYFFKDNTEQSSLAKALSAILHQLFLRQPQLLEKHALPVWKTNGDLLSKESGQLWQILRRIAVDEDCHPTICVLDALDECADADRRELIQNLCDLHSQISTAKGKSTELVGRIRFFLTSRPYDSVQRWFERTVRRFPHIRLKGEETNKLINSEINLVIEGVVEELVLEYDLSERFRIDLVIQLLGMQNRTYLWLTLALEDIRQALDNSTEPEKVTIVKVPESVSEAYERILARIDRAQQQMVRNIFTIMIGANRPLNMIEMATALAISIRSPNDTHEGFSVNIGHFEKQIRKWCALFVFVEEGLLHFIHQTAKEFLLNSCGESNSANLQWSGSFVQSACTGFMGRLCTEFMYMLRMAQSQGLSHYRQILVDAKGHAGRSTAGFWPDYIDHSQLSPLSHSQVDSFVVYCDENWYQHISSAMRYRDCKLLHKIIELCSATLKGITITLNRPCSIRQPPIVAAAGMGNIEVMDHILAQSPTIDLDAANSEGETALHVAICYGKTDSLLWLIDHGASVNVVQDHMLTCLELAVEQQYYYMAEILLDAGAKIIDERRWALTSAIDQDNPEMINLLLSHGAKGNIITSDGEPLVHISAAYGWVKTITLLAQQDHRCIDRTDEAGETPLHKAVFSGQVWAVDELLFRGAKADIADFSPEANTPLHVAAEMDVDNCAFMLLNWGADPTSINARGLTAFQLAIESESDAVANVILRHNIQPLWRDIDKDVMAQTHRYSTDRTGGLLWVNGRDDEAISEASENEEMSEEN